MLGTWRSAASGWRRWRRRSCRSLPGCACADGEPRVLAAAARQRLRRADQPLRRRRRGGVRRGGDAVPRARRAAAGGGVLPAGVRPRQPVRLRRAGPGVQRGEGVQRDPTAATSLYVSACLPEDMPLRASRRPRPARVEAGRRPRGAHRHQPRGRADAGRARRRPPASPPSPPSPAQASPSRCARREALVPRLGHFEQSSPVLCHAGGVARRHIVAR